MSFASLGILGSLGSLTSSITGGMLGFSAISNLKRTIENFMLSEHNAQLMHEMTLKIQSYEMIRAMNNRMHEIANDVQADAQAHMKETIQKLSQTASA